jgi:hypothetical protein
VRLAVLPGMMVPGAAAVAAGGAPPADPATIVFRHGASNSSSPLTTFSQAGVGLGDEDDSRQFLMLVFGLNQSFTSDTDFTGSASIAGVAATRVFDPVASASAHFTAWMTPRQDNGGPSGTTGTISATRSGGYNTCALALFAIYGLVDSSLAVDDAGYASGNPTTTLQLDTAVNGIVAAMARGANTTALTWTGATEQYDATGGPGGSQRFGAAMASELAEQADYSVTAGSDTGVLGLAVSLH